ESPSGGHVPGCPDRGRDHRHPAARVQRTALCSAGRSTRRSVMTQARALALAAVALVAAVFLAPLGVDVLHREGSLASGDVRYDLNPGEKGLWHASEILPFGVTRSVLGVGDDLRYRKAARLFLRAQPRDSLSVGLAPARAQAQGALEDAIAAENDAWRKSQLINMLGVVSVAT